MALIESLGAGVKSRPGLEGLGTMGSPRSAAQRSSTWNSRPGSASRRANITQLDGSEEVARAGQAYYWPEGHTGWTDEACVFLEVGPVAEMRQFGDHAKAKLG